MSVTVRLANREDGDAVADIRVASSRAAYRGTFTDSYLDSMDPNREHWRAVAAGEFSGTELLVCEVDGRIVGFACYGSAREPTFDFSGELFATYFAPDMIGKGYGSLTMHGVLRGIAGLGHSDMLLWVLEDNIRGRRFYEKHAGVAVSGSRQSFVSDGRNIWEVAYGFRPLPASVATG